MNKYCPILQCTVLLLLLAGAPARADWFLDLSTELRMDDNVTLGELESDIRSDTSLTVSAAFGYFSQIAEFTGLTLFTSHDESVFNHYSALNNHSIGAGLSVNHKFGVGPNVPRLVFSISASDAQYNHQVRDSSFYAASLSLNRRFSNTLEASAGVAFEDRNGDFAAFDTDAWSAFGNAWIDVSPSSWISTTYEYRNGEVSSSGRPSQRLWRAAGGIANVDPAFGEPLLVAYPIDAEVHLFSIDWNRAVLDAGTVYLGIEHRQAFGTGGVDYNSSLLRTGFMYSFDL